jgi:hypothetical protein
MGFVRQSVWFTVVKSWDFMNSVAAAIGHQRISFRRDAPYARPSVDPSGTAPRFHSSNLRAHNHRNNGGWSPLAQENFPVYMNVSYRPIHL